MSCDSGEEILYNVTPGPAKVCLRASETGGYKLLLILWVEQEKAVQHEK